MKENSKFHSWLLASRPKTLLASVVPVMVGTALAINVDKFNPLVTLVALVCSLLIQIGTNFTNDLYDFYKGADTVSRKGPVRVLAAGLISVKEMKTGIIIAFLSAFILGLYLVYIGGIIILAIGVLSILAGIAYTAGPYPLAYKGLGDIFVFMFFGLIGTMGTFYLQANELSLPAFLSSIPVGSLITNILVVNNYRDIETDRIAGKNTLAVKLGKTFTQYQFIFLIFVSFIVPLLLFLFFDFKFWIFLPYLTLPVVYKTISMLFTLDGVQLNETLELTAKLSAMYGILFSAGLML
ncbi:MAG: 1,4-dihydroxy-2-naphthoate polyprenyltransferase [Ignavibacteria bacterium GWA2_35_9]|nr:MAG: 1,4-dihydroxy-2-naphthoate polyprenyltransferase [Ignavibacteria bacterium GWA2_35_9]OGU43353.1 MAG: 1,4-dihydroxy-2-naphthoate polyprenyltransferase [Ignavibacteria bacterium GWB2_36_8]OGU51822.1 MAG: 1,4-dihydroxy-2-naphthoate polyprenyltransferase [Ignavibacteria bacterium GWC2_36_12]OGV11449.1 MAG: 1,4-dihydroxy-2-naphthoate polyprenyltransferase [Ignavibacteria bacterium RIFOXYB2_FULL_36_7]